MRIDCSCCPFSAALSIRQSSLLLLLMLLGTLTQINAAFDGAGEGERQRSLTH